MAKKKRRSLGCLFWIVLVLLAVVLFLFNRKAIEETLSSTNFQSILNRRANPVTPQVTITPSADDDETLSENHRQRDRSSSSEESANGSESRPADRVAEDTEDSIRIQVTGTEPARKSTVQDTAANEWDAGERATQGSAVRDSDAENSTIAERSPNVRKSRIFFVDVDADGTIGLKGILRSVFYDDMPLKATIDALLEGLDPSEVSMGILSMISPNTKLRGVSLSSQTAVVDFSEDFRFNPLGIAGLEAQVKQVVYSVTEFANIENVQILIEGNRVEFLASEGIYIGGPLSRESFRTAAHQ